MSTPPRSVDRDESATASPALHVIGIVKRFGHIDALAGADLAVMPGEVHGLVGDNGAGKSTLLKVAAGAIRPDEGTIQIDDSVVELTSPEHARALGVETVYQDLALAETRSCAANVFIGQELLRRGPLGRLGVLDRGEMRRQALNEFKHLGVPISDPRQPVGLLSGGQRQGVAIARASMWARRVVLLDEPTAALGARQRASVASLIQELSSRNLGVLLISHDIPEVLRLCQRITILRLGKVVATCSTDGIEVPYVVEHMVGGGRRS